MAERSKFQFRLRDLLWAVSLIAMSLGFGVVIWEIQKRESESKALEFVLAGLGACLLGAGIGCIFRQPILGALLGIIAAALLWLALILLLFFEVISLGDTL